MKTSRFVVALVLPIVSACSSTEQPLESTIYPVSADLTVAITTALQDEYHAEQIYRRVLADHGAVLPFVNIVVAEQRHASALGGLLAKRNISVPVSVWSTSNVPQFSSVQAACAAAADAEVANIALYDALIEGDPPDDIRTVFLNNRRASLEGHLPAFSRCR